MKPTLHCDRKDRDNPILVDHPDLQASYCEFMDSKSLTEYREQMGCDIECKDCTHLNVK